VYTSSTASGPVWLHSLDGYRWIVIYQFIKKLRYFIAVLLMVALSFSFCSCGVRVYTKVEDYGVFFQTKNLYEDDQLLIFPETLENASVVNGYKYLDGYYGFFAGAQIYLDVTYDEETFAKETEYWSNYKYDDTVVDDVPPKFDDAYLFNYPTFVFEYQSVEYQYISVIEQECRMIYVYIEIGSDEVIPDEFLPKNYYKNTYGADDEDDGYLFSIKSVHDESWYE